MLDHPMLVTSVLVIHYDCMPKSRKSQNSFSQPETFDEAIYRLTDQIAEMIIKKQHDYGKGNILDTPIDPQLAIVVRINDKVKRLGNLLENKKDPANEPIHDSWLDII